MAEWILGSPVFALMATERFASGANVPGLTFCTEGIFADMDDPDNIADLSYGYIIT